MQLEENSGPVDVSQVSVDLPDDPNRFNHNEIYTQILRLIKIANEHGGDLTVQCCRCSFFPLIDLINIGLSGGFAEGLSRHTPHQLACAITTYLWGETVRVHEEEAAIGSQQSQQDQ